jgi:hypothetical protein
MLVSYIIIFACIVGITEYSAHQLESLEENTIKDIGFDMIPYYNNRFSDYIVIGLLILYIFVGKNHTEFIKLCIVLFVLRIIFMNLTVLPVTSDQCKKQNFLPFTGKCRDLVFSGHTSLAVLTILFLISEGTITTLVGSMIVSILYIVTVMARHHYTLDIVIGILASYIVFTNRHKIKILD